MVKFNSDDHYIYYSGQESLRRNGVALTVNQRVQNALLRCSFKNISMILVCFQGKPLNLTVIQIYAPTTNADKADIEWFYEDLQDLQELTLKKMPFSSKGLECKSRKSRDVWSKGKFGLGVQNEAGQRLIEFCQENALLRTNTLFQQHERKLHKWTSPESQH